MTIDSPIQYVKGVGEKRAALFHKLDIVTVGDLLCHYPRAYEDWSSACSIEEAPVDTLCCIRARAVTSPTERRIRRGLSLFQFAASDGKAAMQVTIFNNKYAAAKIKVGEEYLFFGKVDTRYYRREMSSPQIEPVTGDAKGMHPIYPLTSGLSSRAIEKVVQTALDTLGDAAGEEFLPAFLREQYGLCDRSTALRLIHFPQSRADVETARKRLTFEELLLLQLGLSRLRSGGKTPTGAVVKPGLAAAVKTLFPFSLTGAQSRAVDDCLADMQSGFAMTRLLQGDVGSGKTAVAAAVGVAAVKSGLQVAMMAPTEILAEQHANTLRKLLSPVGIEVGLLTAGRPAAEKRAVKEGLQSGTLAFVVGTQALLSDSTVFSDLGLVITDEQHRFGVAQRAKLAAKGGNPHTLVMSATPIPRSLALVIYGDLDISILDELPAGRTPIRTYVVGGDKRERVLNYIKKFVAEGRQAYIVCPLVGDEEEDDTLFDETSKSAIGTFEELHAGALADCRLGLLHGRMKPAEKEAVMAAFGKGDLDVLVATTVIEVGVDVPNAVLMVVENADRFGLAQLHQLRGRVGRGAYASDCILISDARGEDVKRRLGVMKDTTDGFKIADEDLKLRGPGDFFGNRQHGLPHLKIAALSENMAMLEPVRQAATMLLPRLNEPELTPLRRQVDRLFETVGENGLN